MVGKVHGVAEGRVDGLDDEIALSLVQESHQEFDDMSSGQLYGAWDDGGLSEEKLGIGVGGNVLLEAGRGVGVLVGGGVLGGLFIDDALVFGLILGSDEA